MILRNQHNCWVGVVSLVFFFLSKGGRRPWATPPGPGCWCRRTPGCRSGTCVSRFRLSSRPCLPVSKNNDTGCPLSRHPASSLPPATGFRFCLWPRFPSSRRILIHGFGDVFAVLGSVPAGFRVRSPLMIWAPAATIIRRSLGPSRQFWGWSPASLGMVARNTTYLTWQFLGCHPPDSGPGLPCCPGRLLHKYQ